MEPIARIVAVEGLNGVGKSATLRTLEVDNRMNLLRVPDAFVDARSMFEDTPFSVGTCLLNLAISSWLADRAAVDEGDFVLLDRFVGSTRAYAHAAGTPIASALADASLQADLTIVLTCDERVRRRRLAGRELRAMDLASLNPVFAASFLEALRSLEPAIWIDTSNLSIAEVAATCATAIGRSLEPRTIN